MRRLPILPLLLVLAACQAAPEASPDEKGQEPVGAAPPLSSDSADVTDTLPTLVDTSMSR